MKHVMHLALCGIIMVSTITLTAAQQPLTPVMRIGDWVEVGGELPVVVIFEAEKRLKASGFEPGAVDGILDVHTQTALRRYQADKGLPITGKLDQASRQAFGLK